VILNHSRDSIDSIDSIYSIDKPNNDIMIFLFLIILTSLLLLLALDNNNIESPSRYRSLLLSEDDTTSIDKKIKRSLQYKIHNTNYENSNYLPSSSEMNYLTSNGESWIKRFCLDIGNEYYIEVPLSFVEDPMTYNSVFSKFNSPYTEEAMKLISNTTNDYSNRLPDETIKKIEKVARNLYNILHARYIESVDGLKAIKQRYESGTYGQCPRIYCRGHNLLPVGLHDRPGRSSVKCFCSKCQELYQPNSLRHRRIDGVAFGTSLPHLLLQRFPDLNSDISNEKYIPKIYGFKIDKDTNDNSIDTNDDDNDISYDNNYNEDNFDNNNSNETEEIHDSDSNTDSD
jgi:casein kinase II subunit beta